MFDCAKCARTEMREYVESDLCYDTYVLPYCTKYQTTLFPELSKVNGKTKAIIPNCEECIKDKYEFYMKKAN